MEEFQNKDSSNIRKKPLWAKSNIITQMNKLMNQLTLENFQRISVKITEILTTQKLIEDLIKIIVDKSQIEHCFGNTYAKLCAEIVQQLKRAKTIFGDKRGDHLFKSILVFRCQCDFERIIKGELSMVQEIEDQELLRKKNTGHLKFLGQLYLENIFNRYMINYCIEELFGDIENPDEEKIRSLAIILTIVGWKLENESSLQTKKDSGKSLKIFYRYISYLKELSESNKLSKLMSFMCLDLVEMSSNNWKPRLLRETPKTIEEIHVDAMKERLQKTLLNPQENHMVIMARFLPESYTMKPFYAIGIKGNEEGGYLICGHFEGFENEFHQIPLCTHRICLSTSTSQGGHGKGKRQYGKGTHDKGRGKGYKGNQGKGYKGNQGKGTKGPTGKGNHNKYFGKGKGLGYGGGRG